ncbi:MAG: DNA-formamidopyrimidine glycosylase, partial [Chloroflexota bacterium]
MPELPEVETMVRDLEASITARTITAIEAPFPGIVVWPDFAQFCDRVVGHRIQAISRRGKYAIFALDSSDLLVVHRGMTGTLLLRASGAEMEPYVRISLTLDNGSELRFQDARKFGKVLVLDPDSGELPLPWRRMGPEPLNGDFTVAAFRGTLSKRTGMVKPLLLGQRIVAGLGNIYVDEALHLSRIHPRRAAGSLTGSEVKRLHSAIRQVLAAAIQNRGTTFSTYADIEG